MRSSDLGRLGEDLACAFFEVHGYRCLARRWRRGGGELDLVVRRRALTVFVEVKARGPGSYGRAAEAITSGQLRRLRRLACSWRQEHGAPGDLRLDVVTLDVLAEGRGLVLRHFPGVG
ncbi:MAG: YraN family protein [Candidatus Krumholzibacteriia bacterium]